ncbi:MAG: M1 family metallopeptidase [Anaerolineales bacterium]|nr:M1 family metallopeptidase [Anaerolineales bacterium]
MLQRTLLLLTMVMLLIAGTPHPQPAAAQEGCTIDTTLRRTRYEINAVLDWSTKVVQVTQTIRYRNDYDQDLTELVLHSEPHRLSRANVMTFRSAQTEDGQFIEGVTVDKLRFTVPLPEAVPSGCDVVVTLVYDINVKPLSDENPLGWLAYTERQLNLGHWFPTVGLYGYETAGEWYVPDRHYIGEQTAPELADYRVTMQVNNGPAGLQVIAPGTVSQAGNTWTMQLNGARDFAISMSTQFQKTTEAVGDVTVELYTYPTETPASIAQAMTDATQALAVYSDLFGAYPFERLVVVEGDFDDGYEFSGFVFVSEAWFRTWNGTPNHWLTIITIHEIAHQWWYMLVANDQARDPYLDEAFATYSELLYFEATNPDLVQAWWDFRVFRYDTTDPVDITVYEYTQWRPYINAAYLRGVRMLQAVREAVGDEVFFQWLHDYAHDYQGQVASPHDLWQMLPDADYLLISDIRSQYLRNGDILEK